MYGSKYCIVKDSNADVTVENWNFKILPQSLNNSPDKNDCFSLNIQKSKYVIWYLFIFSEKYQNIAKYAKNNLVQTTCNMQPWLWKDFEENLRIPWICISIVKYTVEECHQVSTY